MTRPFKRKPKPRNVHIDDELWAWVQARSQKLKITASEVVRRSLTTSRERLREVENVPASE